MNSRPSKNGLFGQRSGDTTSHATARTSLSGYAQSLQSNSNRQHQYYLELLKALQVELNKARSGKPNALESVARAVQSTYDNKQNMLQARMPFVKTALEQLLHEAALYQRKDHRLQNVSRPTPQFG
jgi:hypothetical protein